MAVARVSMPCHHPIRVGAIHGGIRPPQFRKASFSTFTAGVSNISRALEKIRVENDSVKGTIGSEKYNFMTFSNRELLSIEMKYGPRCIEPITDLLLDPTFDGPAARLLIGSLTRLQPTRQSCYEQLLSVRLPSWDVFLNTSSPQESYPIEFQEAGQEAQQMEIDISERLINCVEKNLASKHQDVVVAGLRNSAKIGHAPLAKRCIEHIRSKDKTIRNAALISSAELSVIDKKTQEILRQFLYSDAPADEKSSAFEAFAGVFPSEENKKEIVGLMQDPNLQSFIQSSDFLNVLLDLPRQDLKDSIERLTKRFTIHELPNSTLRRIVRARFLDRNIVAMANQALARLDNQEGNLREALSRFGLLVHRDSPYVGELIGHAGIFVSENEVIDCTTGRGYSAVKNISFQKWKDGQKCWGIRKEREGDGHNVNLNKAVNMAREIDSWRTGYDWDHRHQKGKWIKGVFCRAKYWEADCVGFTEHVYEVAGGDPIPRDEEKASLFLRPKQQSDNMTKVMDC